MFHLDNIYWKPDKTFVDSKVFEERLNDILSKDEWIIDGNYNSTLELRLQKCDTVFFLDYPYEVCMNGIKERKGKPRTDMPWYEKSDEEDEEFNNFVKNFNKDKKPYILDLLNKYNQKTIITFKERKDALEYLSQLQI